VTPGGIKVLRMSDEEDVQQPNENAAGYQSAYWEGQDSNGSAGLQDVPINPVLGLSIPHLPLSLTRLGHHTRTNSIVSSTALETFGEEYFLDPKTVPVVTVGDPEKHGEGFKDAYVTYEVATEVSKAKPTFLFHNL
jgi:hypothetical protein